jgi:hypothetical protein
MMDNFFHILQRLLITKYTSSSNNHFGGTSPFKVHVNFDIPVFEGQIDADSLDKWLNMLEDHFSVHHFYDKEKITFTLVGTGADLGFNASTTHQQNPNYHPFRQHLRSRCSLTRGRGRVVAGLQCLQP